MKLAHRWDPLQSSDWTARRPEAGCLKRIQLEMNKMFKDPPPGTYVQMDEDDMTLIHAIIIGPDDTPYQGGFFYFVLRFPPNYPMVPPRVRLMTTGRGTVRFNPNLYANGKVRRNPKNRNVDVLIFILLSFPRYAYRC